MDAPVERRQESSLMPNLFLIFAALVLALAFGLLDLLIQTG